MAWLKGFTYDGIESLDYDLYITSGSVYDAPERVVDMIKVPGRNGNLAIDQGRFENIDVEYEVYTKNRLQTDFAQNIRDFRNELCSRHEYLRLTDDYNSDEFRLGIYKSGLELDADIDRAGAIKLTFDCKPQRFLTSGETERSIPEWSDLHTDSGSLVTIDNSGGEYAVKSLSAGIVPQQDLNGYDHPWAGGAGKNMVPDTSLQATVTRTGVTATSSNGVVSFSGTSTSSGAEALMIGVSGKTILLKAGVTYYFSANWSDGHTPSTSTLRMDLRAYNGSSPIYAYETDVSGGTYTPTEDTYVRLGVRMPANYTVPSGLKAYPIITTDSDTTYEPYSNICPITGFSSANIYVSPTTSVGDATTYNVSFGSAGTVYGGTLDVVSGQLTVDRQSVTLDGTESWSKSSLTACDIFLHSNSSYIVDSDTMLSSFRFVNASTIQGIGDAWIGSSASQLRIGFSAYGTTDLATFKTWLSNNPVQLVRKLATPLTYQLTTTQVAFLLGTNNIWSNTGDIQIEYGKGGNTLYNPTLFASSPLIVVTGFGQLGIGSYTITIQGNDPTQEIYIDTDIMEAWGYESGVIVSKNDYIAYLNNTIPKLEPGANSVSLDSNMTSVVITPRWWQL